MTITQEQVTENFKKDLKDLLEKYNATITVEHHRKGETMVVDCQSIWNETGHAQSQTEIDLGGYIDKDSV